jgi:hypothetical protein
MTQDDHVSLQIEKANDGRRIIHLTPGDGTGVEIIVSEEVFLEMRKAFVSDASLVEVSVFTDGKMKVLVD